jgi:hypothetical protein
MKFSPIIVTLLCTTISLACSGAESQSGKSAAIRELLPTGSKTCVYRIEGSSYLLRVAPENACPENAPMGQLIKSKEIPAAQKSALQTHTKTGVFVGERAIPPPQVEICPPNVDANAGRNAGAAVPACTAKPAPSNQARRRDAPSMQRKHCLYNVQGHIRPLNIPASNFCPATAAF